MRKVFSLILLITTIIALFYLNSTLTIYAAVPTPTPTLTTTPTLTPTPTFDQSLYYIDRFKQTYPNYYNYADNLFGGSGSGSGPTETGTGYCDPNNLVQYFGGNMGLARQASCICQKESTGVPDNIHNSCGQPVEKGTSQEYSVGLFQINLNVHPDYAPECNKYIQTGSTCTVTNPGAFKSCLKTPHGATGITDLDPSVNATYAYNLYKSSGNSWKQWSTHTACGLN